MDREFLFIAGAPRTGTTLLSSLLDGHPGLLVFPTEHSTLERFQWNLDDLSYFRKAFLNEPKQGQQALLANQAASDAKRASLLAEFGREFSLDIDCNAFRSAYLNTLADDPKNLGEVLHALATALSESNSHAARTLETAKWLCFKQPFYTELFAIQTAEALPHSKFLHLQRDPVARYISAKTRRQKQRPGQALGPINRLSYVEGHTLVDIASQKLAIENVEALGHDRYKVVSFETLVTEPDNVMEEILQWLGVSADENHALQSSLLGQPTDSRSTISSGEGIDALAVHRDQAYQEITGWNERTIHSSLMQAFAGCPVTASKIKLLLAYLIPLPKSNWKNYLCQLAGLTRWIFDNREATLQHFLTKARAGNVKISGAT